jgi:hypothetical protein
MLVSLIFSAVTLAAAVVRNRATSARVREVSSVNRRDGLSHFPLASDIFLCCSMYTTLTCKN